MGTSWVSELLISPACSQIRALICSSFCDKGHLLVRLENALPAFSLTVSQLLEETPWRSKRRPIVEAESYLDFSVSFTLVLARG